MALEGARKEMELPSKDYEEALEYLSAKLALPKAERERWLNEIVDMWIVGRRAYRARRQAKR
jgi:hypothetical protein